MKKYDVAIVGATGLVGQTFLKVLEEYNFPINNLYLYASKKSEGKIIEFNNKQYYVIELREDKIIDVDVVFMSAGEKISRIFAPFSIISFLIPSAKGLVLTSYITATVLLAIFSKKTLKPDWLRYSMFISIVKLL